MIHGIGYPRSVPRSVALQTVRRLAEETGGLYVAADPQRFELPAAYFDQPFAALDNGATVSFDLSGVSEREPAAPRARARS